jgi:Family of unknown function (DUF5947)
VSTLRRFLIAEPAGPDADRERCGLCATPVPAEHPHLVQVAERRLLCACGPCAMLFDHRSLFDNPGARGGAYARVPDRYLRDPAFRLSDGAWEGLQIPVGMAFFLHNSVRDAVVACYPSPAGATESELTLDAWRTGIGTSPLAAQLAADVEALLVRREPPTCLLVPIDACYRLVGLVRMHWRGFDGGAEAWTAIDAYFADLDAAARDLR